MIEGGVGEGVGFGVLFARDVVDVEVGETGGEFAGALVKGLEDGAFHFVAALHLADEQLGIAADAELADVVRGSVVEGGDERVILGDVVGGAAEIFAKLKDHLAIA